MKIEVGESLACSYLRHVERCWLAQANWKISEHWERSLSDAEIEALFQEMKRRFDRNGAVFKKTKDAAQFLKQGEIDVIGVDQQSGVHAMEVAFHEAGLNYQGVAETDNRVLKKMLRALLILRAYLPPAAPLHISFLSPKVNPAVQRPLEETFAALRKAYPDVGWRLVTNDEFAEAIVKPTLEKASGVADSSELFVRSAKLLELLGFLCAPEGDEEEDGSSVGRIQPLVRALMQTLLVDSPDLLSDTEKRNLQDYDYCKRRLGLQIGNFALIRRIELGTQVNGYARYWVDEYGEFYVCSQWWKGHHCANAESLLAFVEELAREKEGQPGAAALGGHAQAFRDYLAGECRQPGVPR